MLCDDGCIIHAAACGSKRSGRMTSGASRFGQIHVQNSGATLQGARAGTRLYISAVECLNCPVPEFGCAVFLCITSHANRWSPPPSRRCSTSPKRTTNPGSDSRTRRRAGEETRDEEGGVLGVHVLVRVQIGA